MNVKRKGNRTELELSKLLNARFAGGFSRSVGSGNRWSQVKNLSSSATEVFSGDLVVPLGFKFVVESKGGYPKIDLSNICGNKQLDTFLEQVTSDADRSQRKPLLCWKQSRKPWLAFIHTSELSGIHFLHELHYGKWSAVVLQNLLMLDDSFFQE